MNNDMSILSLITNASLLVQAVMAGLLAISIASWTVIFR
ncbi:MAG: protein TolQ, partial [Burkholderiales bacterium]